jgi:hypothetical protein
VFPVVPGPGERRDVVPGSQLRDGLLEPVRLGVQLGEPLGGSRDGLLSDPLHPRQHPSGHGEDWHRAEQCGPHRGPHQEVEPKSQPGPERERAPEPHRSCEESDLADTPRLSREYQDVLGGRVGHADLLRHPGEVVAAQLDRGAARRDQSPLHPHRAELGEQ